MCCVHDWNLSYECLTKFAARKKLREMKNTDPEFWKELTKAKTQDLPVLDVALPEDQIVTADDDNLDDSELPLSVIIDEIITGACPNGTAHHPAGGLMLVGDAERLDVEPKEGVVVGDCEAAPHDTESKDPELGHG